jgi:hypothetical protein
MTTVTKARKSVEASPEIAEISSAKEAFMDNIFPLMEKRFCSKCPYARINRAHWDDYFGGSPEEFECLRKTEPGDRGCYFEDNAREIRSKLEEVGELCRKLMY